MRFSRRHESLEEAFLADEYQRHNKRRQEHLASVRLPLSERTVLEVGAGIGDHTSFFLDRGCTVISTDGRFENVQRLRQRYPDVDSRMLDLDPPPAEAIVVDVVYCYGVLYHLSQPEAAIDYLARCSGSLLLLETCVSYGSEEAINPTQEPEGSPSQALSGTGCRPTRPWIWSCLKQRFEHVYATRTQPWHEQFPVDWTHPSAAEGLTRAVFVASRAPLVNPDLVSSLPDHQERQ